jgi:2-C-methyl-D-erythritol 4-phosphate cytidylyltransferase
MNDPRLPHHCTAILVAAGSGTRMGFDKLLAPLHGSTVLQCSLNRLLECDAIHSIVVVCPHDRWNTLQFTTSGKPITRTDGGALRQDSVSSGLTAAPPESTHIAIHDAARPLVSLEDLHRVITAAHETGAASLAHRIVDTLKRADESNFTRDSVSRENLWSMETPQVFSRTLLQQAISLTLPPGVLFTDEASLLETAGYPVLLVESLHPNPKITTPADLALASAILSLTKDPAK